MTSWRRAARAWGRLSPRGRVGAAVAIVVLGGLLASVDVVEEAADPTAPAPRSSAPTATTDASPSARPASPSPSRSSPVSPSPSVPPPRSPDTPRGDDALVLRSARVVGVVDGDTLDLDDGTRVRLAIVDTPEVHGGVEPCGREASAFTREFVLGRDVTVLRPSTAPVTDTFGRLVGEVVRVDDGASLNVALVAAGLGEVDERFTSEDPDLADRARAAGAGATPASCAATAAPPSGSPPPEPGADPTTAGRHTGRTDGGWSCHDAYRECLPAHLSDLDCPEVEHRVSLRGDRDPWRLDGNSDSRTDGVGCESYPPWSASRSYPYE